MAHYTVLLSSVQGPIEVEARLIEANTPQQATAEVLEQIHAEDGGYEEARDENEGPAEDGAGKLTITNDDGDLEWVDFSLEEMTKELSDNIRVIAVFDGRAIPLDKLLEPLRQLKAVSDDVKWGRTAD